MAAVEHLAVRLLREPSLTEGHDVVDLALVRREVAELVLALEIACLDDPAGGPGEKARGLRALAPSVRTEDDALEAGFVEMAQEGARGDQGALLEPRDAAPKGRVVDEDAEEGL